MKTFRDFPIELAWRLQWLDYFLLRTKEGKFARLPIGPASGHFASLNDPADWGSQELALQRLSYDARLRWVGFVLSEADPYTGIEFHHCRDPRSGQISPQVFEWLTQLNSYTEICGRGTGVQVIVRARLPAIVRRRKDIELYDRRRMMVFTCRRIKFLPRTIEACQATVDALLQTAG